MRRRWSFKILVLVAAAGILLFFTSCYKDYDLDTTDYDIVVTDYDPKADFQSKDTYTMPDEIINAADPDTPLDIPPDVELYIFAEIREKMGEYGYAEVAADVARHISVLIAGAESDYYYYYSGCWPYYGYTYCWDYPYYGGYYEYAFTTGSLLIQMIDAGNVPPPPDDTSEAVSVIWVAGISGIEDDLSASYAQARIEARIDQAFAQSPYLDRTP
jgi:hypothetical protein